MRAVIGQFYGPYSTVRPAKFESSPDAISFLFSLSKSLRKKILKVTLKTSALGQKILRNKSKENRASQTSN